MSVHSSALIAEARQMHDAGWSCYRIAKIFRRRGVSISDTTVATWVDPVRAEYRRRLHRQSKARANAAKSGGRLGAGPPRSPQFRAERMRSLRALGMSHSAISKVMTFDFPAHPVSEEQVRYMLRDAPKGRAA